MGKSKIPRRFRKFNKMPFYELSQYVKMNFNYELVYDKESKYYQVYNYFGKCLIQSDSPEMIVYWLSIFK